MTVRITPLVHSGAVVELSAGTNIFEKEVLPYGKFGYRGDSFEITPEWVDKAIQSFEDRAFDQTVVALADEDNSHKVDKRPDRFGGEVIKFKKTPKGLSAVVQLTNKVADLVRDNKKLGVSVRFREGYTREADGKSWPVVIDQVLGTLDPRITGMEPWKEITLSNIANGTEIKDSSNEEWVMPEDNKKTDEKTENEGNVTLTKEEYDAIKALLAKPAIEEKKEEEEEKKEPVTVGLSNESSRVIELSQQVAYGRYERDAQTWKLAGVPPKIVELAAGVLASYDDVKVVSLSNDGTTKTVDAKSVVKAILDECKGMVELSNEQGHSGRDAGVDEEFEAIRKAILNEANQF